MTPSFKIIHYLTGIAILECRVSLLIPIMESKINKKSIFDINLNVKKYLHVGVLSVLGLLLFIHQNLGIGASYSLKIKILTLNTNALNF
ncbi:hypothetical protein BpHYR1_042909 [Brachionus plicatilis]|uniref:Uncharacterized protein n=1 Tax=Brachionus plicatilis TaxID=10195 RepID=A0A3M7T510_BRAPC|nr:hypothetical protein BpHYR1_042909 [Brachionus plicatilis]